ncbi:MAG: hypothetical protein JO077_26620, partial [Verrucomicrobia bacterium]|nr:hypothetical protein [Verrucomicrobiota bacterium]
MKILRHLFWNTLLIAELIKLTAGTVPAQEFETPPTVPARILVPQSLLSGEGFHVGEQVPTDGLMAHFTIRSDVGIFPANSIEMLKIRVAEIPAIMELNKTSKTKVFAQSVATNAARPVQAAGQMVMHPVDTVTGLPAGVGRFFGRVGLAGQKLKAAATEPEEASAGEKAGQFGTTAVQATRNVFGYEQERRELAKKLHVDPYTTNPVLAKQLDDFALTAFRAHVGVTTTMSIFIPGSMAITATRVVSSWVWDTPKADLIVRDEKTLQRLNVPATTIKTFMGNPVFPLSVQTAFVTNLERLSGVPGTVNAVKLASTAESEVQARFLTDAVGMLVRYNQTETPITRLIVRRAIIGHDRNGAIVVEAPVDYVSWTELMSYFAHRPDLATSRRTIWLTGQLSPIARKNFTTLGWTVNERVNP